MELHIFAQNYKVIALLLANQNQVFFHVCDCTQYRGHCGNCIACQLSKFVARIVAEVGFDSSSATRLHETISGRDTPKPCLHGTTELTRI